MTSRNERLTKLLLTQRAISDLVEIEVYSVQQWGKRTAGKYLGAIESGLQLIRENPRILRSIEGLPAELKYYRVNKHQLICDVRPASIIVLTVIHGSMDLPERLGELLPGLVQEVSLLHDKLSLKRKK